MGELSPRYVGENVQAEGVARRKTCISQTPAGKRWHSEHDGCRADELGGGRVCRVDRPPIRSSDLEWRDIASYKGAGAITLASLPSFLLLSSWCPVC